MIDTRESTTAKICSFVRAYHSSYAKEKIFDDYLAYDLMGKEEYEEIGRLSEQEFGLTTDATGFCGRAVYPLLDRYVAPIPLSRIAYAERELEAFAAQNGSCQYVICGAGMDTFSFRNTNPNIRTFELDHPDTQRYKLERIEQLEWNVPENARYVPIDFSQDDLGEVLAEAGYDPAVPSFFAILGVTYYLTLPVFEQTVRQISEISVPGNKIVFDYPDETTFTDGAAKRVRLLTQITAKLGEPMKQGSSYGEMRAALGRHRFAVETHMNPQAIQSAFFNGRTDGQQAFENIHFILAVKGERKVMTQTIFTSESVTKGHPDKVSDIISDSVLDAYLQKDAYARVAVETVVKNNTVILVGEISSQAKIDTEAVVRQAIRDIGYNREELGFNGDTAELILRLDAQSPDIARGVNRALEIRGTEQEAELGAGDQGMVFGYASSETGEYMPLPVSLAHRLARRLTDVREDGTLAYLRPDGKTQVSVRYENGRPAGVDTIIVSAQHDPDITEEALRGDIIREVIRPVIPADWLTESAKILVNPTGRFVIGGPVGDSGLTGRKIIVDTYGGAARHGGGAFSGKDPTKVDRSAAYAARHAAKNIVAAGLAEKAEIQIAYAIGVAAPVSVNVNTFGTGKVPDEILQRAVTALTDLRPGAIIRRLELQRPIYAQTAAYGHFGRTDLDLPWERTDLAQAFKAFVEESK